MNKLFISISQTGEKILKTQEWQNAHFISCGIPARDHKVVHGNHARDYVTVTLESAESEFCRFPRGFEGWKLRFWNMRVTRWNEHGGSFEVVSLWTHECWNNPNLTHANEIQKLALWADYSGGLLQSARYQRQQTVCVLWALLYEFNIRPFCCRGLAVSVGAAGLSCGSASSSESPFPFPCPAPVPVPVPVSVSGVAVLGTFGAGDGTLETSGLNTNQENETNNHLINKKLHWSCREDFKHAQESCWYMFIMCCWLYNGYRGTCFISMVSDNVITKCIYFCH